MSDKLQRMETNMRLEHATIDGRAHTFIIGAEITGHCEQRGDAWQIELTSTYNGLETLIQCLPSTVALEPLMPGYCRVSGMIDGYSVTNALTHIARLN
jgi:hypothetical protein